MLALTQFVFRLIKQHFFLIKKQILISLSDVKVKLSLILRGIYNFS